MKIMTAFQEYLDRHFYSEFDIKAVLFDMDGVLYDSMKYHSRSWFETMNEFGYTSTPEEFYLHEGRTGGSTIDLLTQRCFGRLATDEEKKRIYARKSELFTKYNEGDLIPFSLQMVKAVKAMGLKCVLVTGSGQKSLLGKLDHNFPGIFTQDAMVTAFDVKKGKPDPEPYLMGLKKAGNLAPNQAVVVENAPMGVEAAVAAGIFTFAINTGPIAPEVLSAAGANIVLSGMEDLYNNWSDFSHQLGIK